MVMGALAAYGAYSLVNTESSNRSPLVVMSPEGNTINAVQKAAPSVVSIKSSRRIERQRPQSLYDLFFNRNNDIQRLYSALGSAVVIDQKGYLLTNLHIVQGATDIEVELSDGANVSAYIIGYDEQTDLAILKVDSSLSLPAIEIGTAENLKIGSTVFAIGNPLGLGQTVTRGIVSATNRDTGNPYAWFIQTDAAINQGNSGGALINDRGKLLGISSFIVTQSGGSNGLGFAIPVDIAMDVASQIIEKGKVARGWVGYLEAAPLSQDYAEAIGIPTGTGLQVQALQYRSPMMLAGVQLGDVITHCNDQPATTQTFNATISASRPGDTIRLKLWRDGSEWETEVNVVEKS